MILTSALTTRSIAPSAGSIEDLQAACAGLEPDADAVPARLDLSAVGTLGPAALLYLLGLLAGRLQSGARTVVVLPRSAGALDALAASRLDEAVQRVAGEPFDMLLDDDSYARWSAVAARRAGLAGELLPPAFASVRTALRAVDGFGPEVPARWSRDWQSALVRSVLDAVLADKGRYIATHVVHEAVMNAVRHPGASVVACAAATGPADGDPAAGDWLTLAIWDDGDGITSTLRRLATVAAVPEAQAVGLFNRTVHVTVDDGTGLATPDRIVDNQDPVDGTDDASLLLAATFPGVTCEPYAPGRAHRDTVAEVSEYALPGMGLFVLCTTVAEVLKGEVEIRCGEWTMTVTRGPAARSLAVALVRSARLRPLSGNLVTVRVPRGSLPTR